MTFSSTIKKQTVFGDMKVAMGTFTQSGGDTGGDIETGLNTVVILLPINNSAGLTASPATTNETFPCADPVTIITEAGATGIWIAFGY